LLAQFTTDYNDDEDQDAVVTSYESQFQTQLSSTGYSQLYAFVQAAKTNVMMYIITSSGAPFSTYYSDDPIFTGENGSYFDDGLVEIGSYDGSGKYTCDVYPQTPSIAYNGSTVNGSTQGLTGSDSRAITNKSTTPPGANGEAGAGTIYTVTFTYVFLFDGTACSRQIVTITQTVEEQIAFTKVVNTYTPPTACDEVGGFEICDWTVAPACSNTNKPDYDPLQVRDEEYPAWYLLADCDRLVYPGPHVSAWSCLLGVGLGVSSTTDSPYCTYNPQY
jgi:hypothetical protein